MVSKVKIGSLKIESTQDPLIKSVTATVAVFGDTSDVFDETNVSVRWNTNTTNTELYSRIESKALEMVDTVPSKTFDTMVSEAMQ